ncbi:hypothetical protein BH24ACT22_BH24ACT22_01490 [soil metagenome]
MWSLQPMSVISSGVDERTNLFLPWPSSVAHKGFEQAHEHSGEGYLPIWVR